MRLGLGWLVAFLAGCSIARPLVPLRTGATAFELSVPGVLTGGDELTFPVGVLLLGARHGLDATHELRLRLHTMPLLKGIVGLEGGGVWHVAPARGWLPALHLTGDLSVLTKPSHYVSRFANAWRGAASVAAIAHVEPLAWLRPYLVWDNALVLANGAYVASLYAGLQVALGRFELSVESGLTGFNYETLGATQPFVGIAGRGAIWISWGLAYRLEPDAAPAVTTESAR